MASPYDVTSRYRMAEDNITAVRVPTVAKPQTKYTTYFVKQSDTLESIAARHLGNQRRFWEIADMNPQIQFPWDIQVGDVLRLPI